jgi:hypothetical protein
VRHVARLAIAAWAVLAMATAVGAGETFQTDSFALTLPDRWVGNFGARQVSARGPAGELLKISATSLSGQGAAEVTRILGQVEEKAVQTMRMADSDSALVTVTPLKKSTLSSGATLHEMLSKSRDGKSLFAQFAARGPRSLVFMTLELPASAGASVDAIRRAVVGIRWVK